MARIMMLLTTMVTIVVTMVVLLMVRTMVMVRTVAGVSASAGQGLRASGGSCTKILRRWLSKWKQHRPLGA